MSTRKRTNEIDAREMNRALGAWLRRHDPTFVEARAVFAGTISPGVRARQARVRRQKAMRHMGEAE